MKLNALKKEQPELKKQENVAIALEFVLVMYESLSTV